MPKRRPVMDEPFRLLIYGLNGCGKTHLLGTAVEDKRVMPALFLDFEAGTMPIRSKTERIDAGDLADHKPSATKLTVVALESWGDFQRVYDVLHAAGHDNPYRTVMVDSLTEANYLDINYVVENSPDVPRIEPGVPDLHDYKVSATHMRGLIRALKGLRTHLVVTCALDSAQNPLTRSTMWQPNLTGKLAYELPGQFDIVGLLEVREDDDGQFRTLVCREAPSHVAKDRSEGQLLGEEVDEPTIAKLLDLLGL